MEPVVVALSPTEDDFVVVDVAHDRLRRMYLCLLFKIKCNDHKDDLWTHLIHW